MFREIYSIWVYFILDSQEKIVFKTPKQHKKSAAEGGRLLRQFFVFCTIIFWESKIEYTHIEYISWNIFFSRSNYVFKNRFLMNFAEFWEFGRLGVG